jgi:peptide/nickel transport system permease protein
MILVTKIKQLEGGAKVGVTFLIGIMLVAICSPVLAPDGSSLSPFTINLLERNLAPGTGGHFLGTDNLGHDIFGLAAWGCRASLLVGLCSALAAVMFGSFWGAISAFAGGLIEEIMMRIVDVLLAIPTIIFLLVVEAFIIAFPYNKLLPAWILSLLGITSYSNGLLPLITIILVISSTSWLESARICSARIKTIRSEEYIDAARAAGQNFWQILTRHLLPNTANIILIEGTLLVADAILMEAGLSFLGLGLGPATPSWGSMLNGAQSGLIQGNWWSVVIPGLLVTMTVMSIQLIGHEKRQ